MNRKKLCLVSPSLASGGAERVLSVIANEVSEKDQIEVHLILFLTKEIEYDISSKVKVHYPKFLYSDYTIFLYLLKTFWFLRKTLKMIQPQSLLSFGGKYNSFVLASAFGLNIKAYISDRSKPNINYGPIQNLINPLLYRYADGIIAQTELAKTIAYKSTKNRNIKVIPNPVLNYFNPDIEKSNCILNVGRFIKSKQQELLIDIFIEIDPKGWILKFIGDGECLENCKTKVLDKKFSDRILFYGHQYNVASYYQESKVFAFPSVSEGFPNALAEAMAAGCACISYDCSAGPADIIDDGLNGFLIEEGNVMKFKDKLDILIRNAIIREEFSKAALEKMKIFDTSIICKKFISMITA